jgi:hypothetical protein
LGSRWLFFFLYNTTPKSNSNSLSNQLSISNFDKTWPPTVWQINLVKIETCQNLPPCAYICVRRLWLPSAFPSRGRV